jgi:predicted RNase H-like HicB family nuclease
MCYGELMDLPVVLRAGEDGFLVAECPAIPGCISQGRTREEALQNIREAIELCLENQLDEGWLLPLEYEIVRVAVG